MQWPIGGLSDRIDRRYVIALSMAVTTLFCVCLISFDLNYWALMAIIGLFGGFAFALYPLAISHANDFVEAEDAVGAAGGLLLIYSVAAVVGPFLGGYMMEKLGVNGFPIYFIIITTIGACFTLYRMMFGKTVAEEDRGAYQVMPRTSTLAAELSSLDEE